MLGFAYMGLRYSDRIASVLVLVKYKLDALL
jgi:hypothetical protein